MVKNVYFDASSLSSNINSQHYDTLEALDQLSNIYTQLNEVDQLSIIWKRRAFSDKTTKCLMSSLQVILLAS